MSKQHNARYYFRVYRKPTEVFGLRYSPYLVLGNDDAEDIAGALPDPMPKEEWGLWQRKMLIATVKALKPDAAIVEIGVHKSENGWNSSTQVIMRSRRESNTYVGLDWRDRSEVVKDKPNAHVFMTNTRDVAAVDEALHNAGVGEIGLLILDGGRSVNQLMRDWLLAERVASGGFVVLHGTACYPGPHVLSEAIDQQLFQSLVNSKEELGMAVFTRR